MPAIFELCVVLFFWVMLFSGAISFSGRQTEETYVRSIMKKSDFCGKSHD